MVKNYSILALIPMKVNLEIISNCAKSNSNVVYPFLKNVTMTVNYFGGSVN